MAETTTCNWGSGLTVLNNSKYVYENWHGTLISIAVGGFALVIGTLFARKLALIEGISAAIVPNFGALGADAAVHT